MFNVSIYSVILCGYVFAGKLPGKSQGERQGKAIQRSLQSSVPPMNTGGDAKVVHKFSDLMMEG